MKFYAVWQSYSMRYFGWLNAFLSMCAWMLLYPLALGKGFMFFKFFKIAFFSDIRLTGIFLGMIALFQIVGWDITNKHIKILEILEDKIVFSLFNGKVFEFNYNDIKSISLINDMWLGLIFEISLVSGEKVKIRERIKNKHQALELIQKKLLINESNR